MPIGAAIGVAGIGAGASVISANKQSKAAERGIEAQTEAAANSDRIALEIYQDQAARNEPFRQLGVAAINPFADLLGLDYQTDQAAQPASVPQQYRPTQPSYGGYSSGGGVNGFNAFNNDSFVGRAGNEIIRRNPEQFNRRDLGDYIQGGYYGDERDFSGNTPNIIPDGQGGYRVGNNIGKERLTNGTIKSRPSTYSDYMPTPEPTQEQRTQNAFNTLRSRPGFQFQFDQGLDAIDQSAASRGMLLSGAQQRALTEYGQDYGSNAYDKELNRLSLAMGGGQVATNATNQAAGAYGAQTSANALNLGNARASAYQQQGQASANAFNGIAGSIAGGVGIYSGSQGWT